MIRPERVAFGGGVGGGFGLLLLFCLFVQTSAPGIYITDYSDCQVDLGLGEKKETSSILEFSLFD